MNQKSVSLCSRLSCIFITFNRLDMILFVPTWELSGDNIRKICDRGNRNVQTSFPQLNFTLFLRHKQDIWRIFEKAVTKINYA